MNPAAQLPALVVATECVTPHQHAPVTVHFAPHRHLLAPAQEVPIALEPSPTFLGAGDHAATWSAPDFRVIQRKSFHSDQLFTVSELKIASMFVSHRNSFPAAEMDNAPTISCPGEVKASCAHGWGRRTVAGDTVKFLTAL